MSRDEKRPRLIAALIRHGDYHQLAGAPSAHQPFPLNEAGEAQATAAAEKLRAAMEEHGWWLYPLIDSSRLLRGWQTASLLAERLASEHTTPGVESFDQLAERGLGSAANLTVEQVEQVLAADPRFEPPPADWKSNSHYRLPLQGAESLLEAGERVAGHLQRRMEELRRHARDDTLKLFVGHGAAFRHAAYHLGVLKFDEIARLSMYHADPLYLELMPDGEWRHVAGRWKVRAAAETPMD